MIQVPRVREDWEAITRRMEAERRRMLGEILGIVAVSAILLWVTQRFPLSVAWDAFLGEMASLNLYLAAGIWYALRFRRDALWVAGVTYLDLALITAVSNYLTKAGLPVPFPEGVLIAGTRLYGGIVMMGVWLILALLMRRYPDEVRNLGLNFVAPGQMVLYGLLGAAVIAAHLIFTSTYSGALTFEPKPLPYMVWHLFYELGLQSSAEEIFFRGVVFNYLYNWRGQGFWGAAIASSALNVLLYVPKAQWTASPEIAVGAIFYVFIAGMIYAGLYRWFRSLLPSYVCNVTVSLISVFRGL